MIEKEDKTRLYCLIVYVGQAESRVATNRLTKTEATPVRMAAGEVLI